ncbi:OLC1v1013435C1 [Oldenlandia corymbosa var. corymbosa]|uniref:OLC1v1013435C1 n=1 Tax=Oldenlandia corymbosa var. corymbosa TaxID=529605 RepID=A0AAV1DY92_OLDCO|nr:OLC1v1013435C1 [Oldenlandia corymbosa var. corymbosa]
MALRASLSPHLRGKCSTAEVLAAYIWRCRVSDLQVDEAEKVRFINAVSIHYRSNLHPPLPEGYYGNAFAFPAALTSAGELIKNPLDYAVELVMNTKEKVTNEYVKSMVDLMVLRRRPHITPVRSFLVVNLRRVRFDKVDFGWGEPVSGGLATGGIEHIPGLASCFVPAKNKKGENGTVVPMRLPELAMERFVREMKMVVKAKKSAMARKPKKRGELVGGDGKQVAEVEKDQLAVKSTRTRKLSSACDQVTLIQFLRIYASKKGYGHEKTQCRKPVEQKWSPKSVDKQKQVIQESKPTEIKNPLNNNDKSPMKSIYVKSRSKNSSPAGSPRKTAESSIQILNQKGIEVAEGRGGDKRKSINIYIKDLVTLIQGLGSMNNILSWNIRGLNSPLKHREVDNCLAVNRAGVMGLLETKLQGDKVKELLERRRYQFGYISNYENHEKGRILLMWKRDDYVVRVEKLREDLDYGNNFRIWQMAFKKSGSWVGFTWNNKQYGDMRIVSKLDRAFVIWKWLTEFPESYNNVLSAGISDHNCLMVKWGEEYVGEKKSFRTLLINVVLMNLNSYWTSVFLIPQSVIQDITKVCRNFLWGNKETGKKLSLVAWQDLCRMKSEAWRNRLATSNRLKQIKVLPDDQAKTGNYLEALALFEKQENEGDGISVLKKNWTKLRWVGKPPPPGLNESVKENVLGLKKKRIKLQQQKVTWGSKRHKDDSSVEVEILQMQAVAPNELQPAQSQTLAVQTLEAHDSGSTSGLSLKEKRNEQTQESLRSMDAAIDSVPPSGIIPSMAISNRFAALDVTEEELTKNQKTTEDEEEEEKEMPLLGGAGPLDVGRCFDDGYIAKASAGQELESVEREIWCDGDADDISESQIEGSVHKKRGRKSKDEKLKLLDGVVPGRSSRMR